MAYYVYMRVISGHLWVVFVGCGPYMGRICKKVTVSHCRGIRGQFFRGEEEKLSPDRWPRVALDVCVENIF